MFNFSCPNAEYRKEGLKCYFWCKVLNNYCGFQRYCGTKRDVELMPTSQQCKYNKKENGENK